MTLRVVTSVDGRAVTRQLAASEGPVPEHGSAGGWRACTRASDSRVEASNVCMDGCTPGLSDGPRGNRNGRMHARWGFGHARGRVYGGGSGARRETSQTRCSGVFIWSDGGPRSSSFSMHTFTAGAWPAVEHGELPPQQQFFHAHVHRRIFTTRSSSFSMHTFTDSAVGRVRRPRRLDPDADANDEPDASPLRHGTRLDRVHGEWSEGMGGPLMIPAWARGHGYGHGHGHGSGDGYGYGYGSGDGDGYLGGHRIEFIVDEVKVGCQQHSPAWWREHWRQLAKDHGVEVRAAEVELLLKGEVVW